jgi:hypothetical protein
MADLLKEAGPRRRPTRRARTGQAGGGLEKQYYHVELQSLMIGRFDANNLS